MPQQIRRGDEAARVAREQRIIDMRSNGVSFREIGAELGIAHTTAHELWKSLIDKYPARAMQEYRMEQIDLVDKMIRIGLKELEAEHPLLYKGQPVQQKIGEKQVGIDDEGIPRMESVFAPVSDSMPKARFLQVLTALSKRKSEITGSDVPVTVDMNVTQRGEIDAAVAELVAEQERRNQEAGRALYEVEQAARASRESL